MERITELIKHPERLDRDTLYELRSMLALYPYFQTARLLMLQNLFLLHDPSFDEELRRAAIYITDRRVLFSLIEGAHYQLRKPTQKPAPKAAAKAEGRSLSSAENSHLSPLELAPQDQTPEPFPSSTPSSIPFPRKMLPRPSASPRQPMQLSIMWLICWSPRRKMQALKPCPARCHRCQDRT